MTRLVRLLRFLWTISAHPDLMQAFLAAPERLRSTQVEALAKEFFLNHPAMPGEVPDTWNTANRIEQAFKHARQWVAELEK